MLLPRVVLAVGIAAVLADGPAALHVLRAVPTGEAGPGAVVTVTFDRPVAGALDRTVDPARILRLAPQIPGTADWRDPVTLRFRPASPLAAGTKVTVTVSNDFEAMDGSRLEQPYRFDFTVRGPRVIGGRPVSAGTNPRYLTPDQAFELVVDAPADSAQLAAIFVDPGALCRERDPIRLRLLSERTITKDDSWELREAGGWERDRSLDRLRRVVRLAPARPLPRGCESALVFPSRLDAARGTGTLVRWPFATYGDFRLVEASCGWARRPRRTPEGKVVTEPVCPTGPAVLAFSTPVRGAEVLRHVRLLPGVKLAVSDTSDERATWALEGTLAPRTGYAVVVDTALRDVFGQRLVGNPVATVVTTGYAPMVNYAQGRATVERVGYRTFGVSHVNVDTLEVVTVPIPDSLEALFLTRSSWGWGEAFEALAKAKAQRRRIAVNGTRDRIGVYGVPLPAPDARQAGTPTLLALQVTSPRLDSADRAGRPIALVQVTDLGVHAKVGVAEGVVWVTGASDGRPRGGAQVALYDKAGKLLTRAVTDTSGLARLANYRAPTPKRRPASNDGDQTWEGPEDFEGYVAVTLGADRALVGVSDFDPELSPWQFNVAPAWGTDRLPMAGAVFTERGIYRPGEPIYAKAIARTGPLGRLAPATGADSVRWVFRDREGKALRKLVQPLSTFGTADQRWTVPADAALGYYTVAVQLQRRGQWLDLATASYRVAEYRPPEFLVDATADLAQARVAGDSIRGGVEARYLFGAPMGRAAVSWALRQTPTYPWELDIPNTEGFQLGETGFWWEENESGPGVKVVASGQDTLDAQGRLALRLPTEPAVKGRAARVTLEATVTDVNRQTVSASAGGLLHPAEFYLGAKPEGTDYFWTAGKPVAIGVIAVRPDGRRVEGVAVQGVVVRREWHQVRRERAGYGELVGEWVSDTVARCAIKTTGSAPVPCRFTPPAGGQYVVRFTATDPSGHLASTSFYRWGVGREWVPWNDESQFKMDVVPDRARYAVGDTATVLFASPFTDAEAWITVEREGLIEQRRLRITSGTTTLRLPITEAFAPNAFVGIVVARGRSAKPGPLDDPGRPTIRVGFAELRVTPERKRLTVAVTPLAPEYRPGDSARVRLAVTDARGAGQPSEVTLWAVDEGVLALTGYRTPDPIDLIYQRRGLGMRLASDLVSVAPQIPEGEKGRLAPGGGGGLANADVLRSRFQTTAFFLGSVVTDAQGRATATAKLPDNLTTFRVMAVAVTAGDRYGSGDAKLLVTRPLVARPALPRFLRSGDRLEAGVVVNHRAGGTPKVRVQAAVTGAARLEGAATKEATLAAGRGTEVRFDLRAAGQGTGDSATFRFAATSLSADTGRDAVRLALPIRPVSPPRAYTIAGVVRDTASVVFTLPEGTDPARSTLTLNVGTSPLAVIRGAREWFRVYRWLCTEQLASALRPLTALYRFRAATGADSADAAALRAQITEAVDVIERRLRPDGGIGLWGADGWATPWLTAYAVDALLDARQAGVAVDDSVLARAAGYLTAALHQPAPRGIPVVGWYVTPASWYGDRVMAADVLSRLGRRQRAAENELLRVAPQLFWEDRARLAEVVARGGDTASARQLLAPLWASVRVEGRRAVLPDSAVRTFYFRSTVRPAAYLLSATLAAAPEHPLVAPLAETLLEVGRSGQLWNTQDVGTAVDALLALEARERASAGAGATLRVRAGSRVLLQGAPGRATADSVVALTGLLTAAKNGAKDGTVTLPLRLEASGGSTYYFLTVTEIPRTAAVRPDARGIRVERWYEDYATGKPIVSAPAGALVRVRLRVTVPDERHMVVLDDPLPAGLEAVDLSLRTTGALPGPGATAERPGEAPEAEGEGLAREGGGGEWWAYGSWDGGWWSPFDHRELRDDRVVYFATVLWKGSYTATYVARATTPGVFVRPPAQAEEMYNRAVAGRSDGGVFTVTGGR
ncbi:MAG TPA: alpha-2-macroglobulin family protein [Gemmatimonadales bacterium]|nr:alpha-2-macroglobulin family protein [Gemmatimonadales bacterium]